MNRRASTRPDLARLFLGLELAIFDCDGVLFESRRANAAYYNAVLGVLGFPPLTRAQEEFCHRSTTRQLFEHLFGAGSDPARRALKAAAEQDYAPLYPLMTMDPGARPLLSTLKQRGVKTGMATNRGVTVPGLLAHYDLGGLFDCVVTSLDVRRAKPAPDMLLLCLERMRVAPGGALYVGDADVDQEAAAAAEMRFLAVGNGGGLGEAVRAADLTELLEALSPADR